MMHNKKTAKPDTTDKKPNPLKKKDIQQNPDNRIDQDFPGYPHSPGSEKIIRPETENEKEIADTDNKDGEKRNYRKKLKEEKTMDDGSANAFVRTEDIPKEAIADEPEENY
jgi:hypothetical protein